MTEGLLSGAFGSTAQRLSADTRMECGVCWTVYDPAEGCETWEVPPDTPFSALPDHWRCPTCDNDKAVFMPVVGQDEPAMADRVAALEDAFRAAEAAFLGTPFHNAALRIEAVGFRPWEDAFLGILITPWFMNIILLPQNPAAWDALVPGAVPQPHMFPAGRFDFEVGRLEAFGTWQACSLFSTMESFADHATCVLTAQECLEALFTADAPAEPAKPEPPKPELMDRRALLRGHFGGDNRA